MLSGYKIFENQVMNLIIFISYPNNNNHLFSQSMWSEETLWSGSFKRGRLNKLIIFLIAYLIYLFHLLLLN